MSIDELNNFIYTKCKENGLCKAGEERWHGASSNDLIKMYSNEPEFIILQKPFSLSVIKEHFDKEMLNSNGVYLLEDSLDLVLDTNGKDCVFNSCVGNIVVKSWDNRLTISDNSDLTIYFDKEGLFTISVYDLSNLTINSNIGCDVIVLSHGYNNINKENAKGRVKIINKK